MEKKSIDTPMKFSQAGVVIKEIFRRFKKRLVDSNTIKLYLTENDILDTGNMKQIEAAETLEDVEKILPKTFLSSEALMIWMEEKRMVPEIEEIERLQLLHALQRLVENETKYHSKGDCKRRMKGYAAGRRLRSGNEKEETKDLVYYSLLHSIGDVYEMTRVQLKDKLLQYLCRHPSYRFDLKRIDPEAINDWLSFIDYLQGWEIKGHPFVLHAFTEVFNVSLHVISAVACEEYVLYPKRYFKKTNTRRKTYLGHVQRHHYISLSEEPPDYEDLHGEINGQQDHIKSLRRQIQSKYDENKSNSHTFGKTLEDRETEISRLNNKIKQLTDELEQTRDSLEQVTQTAREMKSQFRFLFRFLGNMMGVFSNIDGPSNKTSWESTMLKHVNDQMKAARGSQSQLFSESGFGSNIDGEDGEEELFYLRDMGD